MRTNNEEGRSTKPGGIRRFISTLVLLGLAAAAVTYARAPMNTQGQPWEARRIFAGIVSDAICGAGHIAREGDPECTRLCVKLGSDFALVTGKQVLVLKGHGPELYQFAGRTVVVTGTVHGDTVTVESVAPVDTGNTPTVARVD